MRFLRSAILAVGLMGLATACGGSDKQAETTPATDVAPEANPCAEDMANPCGEVNPCGDLGDDMANPCGDVEGDMENPCGAAEEGAENPCGDW